MPSEQYNEFNNMNQRQDSYDIDQHEIALIRKLIKCYAYCQIIRPELKNKIVFNVKQAEDAGLDKTEEDTDNINLMALLQESGLIKNFNSHDPFDYSSPEDTPNFPGRIIIDICDNFESRAEDRLLELNKKVNNQKGGQIIIYYSPNSGEIRTTEKMELSTKKFIIRENRKVLMNHLFDNHINKCGGLTARDIIASTGYKDNQGVNKAVAGINKQFINKLKKTEKLIINDKGYILNELIYIILSGH